jgi:hypothetical protein
LELVVDSREPRDRENHPKPQLLSQKKEALGSSDFGQLTITQ